MRVKISAGAERDIADGCDFMTTSIQTWRLTFLTAYLQTLILCCSMQEFTPRSMDGTILSLRGSRL
ncbi:MAG: hypothetical protein RLY14_795 [Planctomycetota bacterium]